MLQYNFSTTLEAGKLWIYHTRTHTNANTHTHKHNFHHTAETLKSNLKIPIFTLTNGATKMLLLLNANVQNSIVKLIICIEAFVMSNAFGKMDEKKKKQVNNLIAQTLITIFCQWSLHHSTSGCEHIWSWFCHLLWLWPLVIQE